MQHLFGVACGKGSSEDAEVTEENWALGADGLALTCCAAFSPTGIIMLLFAFHLLRGGSRLGDCSALAWLSVP